MSLSFTGSTGVRPVRPAKSPKPLTVVSPATASAPASTSGFVTVAPSSVSVPEPVLHTFTFAATTPLSVPSASPSPNFRQAVFAALLVAQLFCETSRLFTVCVVPLRSRTAVSE